MNISDKNRRHNLAFLISAIMVSGVMIAGTSFFLKEIFSGEVDGVAKSQKACKEVLKMAAFNFTEPKVGEIKVNLPAERNIETLVYKSGVVISSCPAYTVHDFCAGAGCQTPGLAFTLKLK